MPSSLLLSCRGRFCSSLATLLSGKFHTSCSAECTLSRKWRCRCIRLPIDPRVWLSSSPLLLSFWPSQARTFARKERQGSDRSFSSCRFWSFWGTCRFRVFGGRQRSWWWWPMLAQCALLWCGLSSSPSDRVYSWLLAGWPLSKWSLCGHWSHRLFRTTRAWSKTLRWLIEAILDTALARS